MKVILSISGGGMRGVIPARVLVELERRLGFTIAGCVDLIAGTSTGGILACLAASPKDLTAAAALRFYYQSGPKIFSKPWYRALTSGAFLAGPRYSGDVLATELKACTGDVSLSDCRTKIMLPTVDAINVEAVFIKSWDAYWSDFPLWGAATASASAQTYFPAFSGKYRREPFRFIDGGNHTNNPAASALFEAERLWPGEEKVLIHLGTGRQAHPKPLPDGGLATWAPLVFGTTSECQDDTTRYYLKHWPAKVREFSFDVNLAEFPGMDDASTATLDFLVRQTELMLAEQAPHLVVACDAIAGVKGAA